MDPVTQLRLTRELVDIDSTTGREGEAGAFIAAVLRRLGYHVVEQPVSEGRFNVVATIDSPVVVLSTHFDCVPPLSRLAMNGGTQSKCVESTTIGGSRVAMTLNRPSLTRCSTTW